MNLPPYQSPDLRSEVARWLAHTPEWYLRLAPADEDDQSADFYSTFYAPSYRYAAAEEIAAEIVSNPELREGLGFLASPPGQLIEQTVAQLWLPGPQAQLLTDGLTQAWKIVLNQNRPAWQRADVLVGTVLFLSLIGLVIWASRDSRMS
jgi:hypothetical protein